MNALAQAVARAELSNGDVAVIAGAACSSMRTALREDLPTKIPAFLGGYLEGYPRPDVIERISKDEFKAYEITVFKEFGASRESADFVAASIEASPVIPPKLPGSVASLEKAVSSIEQRSCRLREEVAADLAARATEKKASTARLLAKGTIGVAAMVADAAIVVYAPYIGVTVLSFASGGWGWNRVEEVYFELRKDDE